MKESKCQSIQANDDRAVQDAMNALFAEGWNVEVHPTWSAYVLLVGTREKNEQLPFAFEGDEEAVNA